MLALDYTKKKLCQMAAIALGAREQNTATIVVSVRSGIGCALLEAHYNEVVRKAFGVKHVSVQMSIIDNDRNVDRLMRYGLSTSLIGKRYSHTDDEQYARQYHALRFAEKLNA